jgi:N-glycosylase/DNA lyase
VIENLVDRLILDEISFGRACDKLDEEFGSAEDVGNQKELTVDKFLQLVVVSGLMDFLLGIKISGESNNIWAFFSDAVKEKTLQEFLRVVREYCTDAALYPSREEGAAWVVSVLNPRVDKNPETSGEIDRAVDVLGSVEVQ